MAEQGDAAALRRGSMEVALRSPRSTTTAPQRPPRAHQLSKRSSTNGVMVALGSGNARRHPSMRPATSPHATHAMVLQLQEYHDRLEKACGSTYQFALQPPPPRGGDHDDRDGDGEDAGEGRRSSPRNKGYCRARLLQSSRAGVRPATGDGGSAPPPAFSTRVGVKDCVLPATNVYVAFHQTTPRCSEYLYGNNQESARRMRLLDSMASAAGVDGASSSVVVTKDHFALGPGQYDVPAAKSGAAGGAKFSPSDRFHENYSTDHPGPGQYLMSEALVSPRAAAAVFSQRPRETDLGSLVSPTANVVSSYYYVAESTFDAVASASSRAAGRVGWSRTARFKSTPGSRHDRALLQRPPRPSTTDFVAKNMAAVQQAPGNRARRGRRTHREGGDGDADALRLAIKRRSSLVASLTSYRRATQATASSASKGIVVAPASPTSSSALQRLRGSVSSREHVDVLLQSWITIAYMASFQAKLVRFRALLAALGRLRDLQARTHLSVTFRSWQKLDVARNRQYAAQLIARNTVRLRLWLRIEKKRRHASRLRQFLHGLSFDVRFALSMKRIKRKIVAIQRWWRHVQLMVRAREEALYHKWLAVETRLRLEYINQLPHLQRIFTPPAGTVAAAASAPVGAGGASFSAHSSAHASDLQLHKVLNLPDQQRWFPGKFVLSSDGSLRGFALDTNELLVEVRNFRCHYHDVSAGGADDTAGSGNGHHHHRLSVSPIDTRASYTSYTNATWKPFLMLFRQGAFRFVVITSLSPLPTELLSWKDKLERLMVNPTSSFAASGASFSGGAASGSYNDLSFFSSVGDFVEVSMQSGILAPALTSEGHSGNSNNGHRPSKFQARVRSIRQRAKSGVNVAEGSLNYYVVDLLKDLPKVPTALVWATIREKLREKRKAFRAEIYRYKLEMFHYQEHQQHVKHMHVLAKFRDFFTLERPRRPHFRSLISNRKMEAIIRATAEQVKASTPSNPRLLLDSSTLKQ